MNKITTLILLIISLNILSQEKKNTVSSNSDIFISQCNKIGQSIIKKNKTTKLKSWYEGTNLKQQQLAIKKLELDINTSDLDVTYYLTMMNEKPLIYNFHFYNRATKTEFGNLLIKFKDRKNNLVDDIQVISKNQLKKINTEVKNQSLPKNIPLPPPPPPLTKKN